MEKILIENKFKKTVYDKQNDAICNYWTSALQTDEEYMHEIKKWIQTIEEYKPRNILADTQKFSFVIQPELQKWYKNEILHRIKALQIQKFAIVISSSIPAHLSIEQMLYESKEMNIQYFFNPQLALVWFNEK